MYQKALDHFQHVDPILYAAACAVGPIELTPSVDYFRDLCAAIVSQQLSDKVSTVIFDRFKKLFPNEQVTAEQVMQLTHDQLRNIGISHSKVNFIRDLAGKVVSHQVGLAELVNVENDQVITALTQVKGIGPWTAEMFLMFSIARPDIFSAGDLGLLRAIQKLYHLDRKLTRPELLEFSQKWSPYRTYACRILWKSLK